jgi:DNA primase
MPEGKNWVDYKEIKEKVTLGMVLTRYGLLSEMKSSGNGLTGCCPIHKGSNPRQFVADLKRNIFHCFGDCKGGGNVLDFVAKMEGVTVREAALLLKDWFLVGSPGETEKPEEPKKPVRKEREAESETEAVNPALKFELKNLKRDHPFFEERGILPAVVKYFGLGFCTKGLMKDRIVIPIHNEKGELVAYGGRAVTDEQAEKEGKYKLPPKFVKSAVVYNLNRQDPAAARLILVESFLSVFKLHELGFPQAVALMGSELSREQERLIVEFLGRKGRAVLMFDADESGRHCAEDCLARLSRQVFVRVFDIDPKAKKPHHLSLHDLSELA